MRHQSEYFCANVAPLFEISTVVFRFKQVVPFSLLKVFGSSKILCNALQWIIMDWKTGRVYNLLKSNMYCNQLPFDGSCKNFVSNDQRVYPSSSNLKIQSSFKILCKGLGKIVPLIFRLYDRCMLHEWIQITYYMTKLTREHIFWNSIPVNKKILFNCLVMSINNFFFE